MNLFEESRRNWLKRQFSLKFIALNVLVFVFSFVLAHASFAQPGKNSNNSGGWGAGHAYDRMYDPKTVTTVHAEVISIQNMIPLKGMSTGVHLLVKTGTETIDIHLGPTWFIDKQDLDIRPKDKIEILGSRITYEGKPAIIAAEIIKGDEKLVLRNENGTAVWSGWRQR